MKKATCRLTSLATVIYFFILPMAAAAGAGALPDSLQLTVTEQSGYARDEAFVSCGVPLPRDWDVSDSATLRLRDGQGNAIPCQFDILARWGASAATSSAPAKWVLMGFLQDIDANASNTLYLDRYGPGPAPVNQIQTDSSVAGKLSVNTGPAQFTLNTDDTFNLIHQVVISGQEVLDPLANSAAIDADLRIVAGGTPNSTPRTSQVSIERSGPLCTIVKAMGSILDTSARPLLDFTARLHFYSGSTAVRIDYTVENNQPVMAGTHGQPNNVHQLGAVNSVYIDALKLTFKLKSGSTALNILSEPDVSISSPTNAIRLYQDSSGTSNWDAYEGSVGWEGVSAAPRLQSYCSQSGYDVTGPGVIQSGPQALGWMSIFYIDGVRICMAASDFWQNFPKALEAHEDGTIFYDLFPNGTQFNHNLRVGEEKTHSFLVEFGTGAISTSAAQAIATAYNQPLFAVASPEWTVGTGALGFVPAADATTWPRYENYVNVAHEPSPDGAGGNDQGFGNRTLMEAIERYNFYGWQDYGDVPLDYESFGDNQAGQMNLKYWYVYGMLVQFCRSGLSDWLDLALPAARHLADIDFLHIPDSGIAHWSHGTYFGHSSHDEPGNLNPNRNYNSPSLDLLFGVPDLFLAYYLTGEQRFLDVAGEGLEAMDNLSALFGNFSYPVFYRERANLIFAYIEGYKQSGDARWLSNLRSLVGLTADTTGKAWLDNPTAYLPPAGGPEGGDERISGFQMGQVAWTLGRYLDFCDEYDMSDDLNVASSLAAYGDFIIDHMLFDIPSWFRQNSPGEYSEETLQQYEGHVATIDSIWFTSPYETYLEVNNWALLLADVLTYAYKYNQTKRYLDTAAQLYTTGTIDSVWLDDPPVYIATKDLVNACNWGLVYMQEAGAEQVVENGFDYQAYLSINPDLPATWGSAESISHYVHFGMSEGRAVGFDLNAYLNANPDLPATWSQAEALAHYNYYGRNENRLLVFSAREYASLYPDLPTDWDDAQALSHYHVFGKHEGRIPTFDEAAYLEFYPDLPQSWGQTEAFGHYLYYGQYENRAYDPFDETALPD